jgi:hypothetical protein
MPSPSKTFVLCGMLAVTLGACGAKKKEEEEQARIAQADKAIAAIPPKIAHLGEILEDAKKRPVVMGRDLKLPEAGEAGFLYLDASDDPQGESLASCAELSKKSGKDAVASLPVLERCARVTFVIVMHKRSLSAPTVSQFNETFNPGLYDGDAYVYELASGKYVGAFEVRAVSTSAMKTSGPDDQKLLRDLMTNAEKAAQTSFGKSTPN